MAKFLLAAAFTLFLFAAPAHAHVFFEPDLGFEFGTSTQDFKYTDGTAENKSSFSQNGNTIGAALGYRYNYAFMAAQAERGMGGHITDYTALLGINVGVTVRGWIGWIFSAKDDVSKGSGFKIGAGYSLSRIFRLNVEYDMRSYNAYTGSAATSTLTYSGTRNSVKFTISAPFQW